MLVRQVPPTRAPQGSHRVPQLGPGGSGWSQHRTRPTELHRAGFIFKGTGKHITPGISPSLPGNSIFPSKTNHQNKRSAKKTKPRKATPPIKLASPLLCRLMNATLYVINNEPFTEQLFFFNLALEINIFSIVYWARYFFPLPSSVMK